MKARIGDVDPAERRRFTRFDVELEARMRELGTSGVDARILNISETGFMAQSDAHFEVGTRVWLMLPGKEATRKGILTFGTIGYIAKGIAVAIVGVLWVVAAVTADSEAAGGLDAAEGGFAAPRYPLSNAPTSGTVSRRSR